MIEMIGATWMIFLSLSSQPGVAFHSRAACLEAREAIRQEFKRNNLDTKIWCVPVGRNHPVSIDYARAERVG